MKGDKILIFAGTTEGRMLTEFLGGAGVDVHACVATEYGKQLIEAKEHIEVTAARLDIDAMAELMGKGYRYVIDATHPYAVIVSGNIKQACEKSGVEYVRLLRAEGENSADSDLIWVPDVASAAEYLCDTEGNVLVATGSKEISKFTIIPNFKDRIYARVLSLANVAVACAELGFEGKNLIAMQGPFSEELNYAMLKQIDAKYMVTKDSGQPGGFDEKVRAARRAGVKTILVGRPQNDAGRSFSEVIEYLGKTYGLPAAPKDPSYRSSNKRKVSLVGIGMGYESGLTVEATEAIADADLLVGADRMVDSVASAGREILRSYRAEEISEYLEKNQNFNRTVVLLSGDVGFYSGAKRLLETLDRNEFDVELFCGISSVVYLCSKLETSWQDAHLMSAHGLDSNVVGEVKRNSKVFSLLNGAEGAKALCESLEEFGLNDVIVTIGQNMGSPEEKFESGKPSEMKNKDFLSLCAALIENPSPVLENPMGISDEDFIRGDAPMTKSEVRTLSVAKLKLCDDSVIYDIGAGTGSVSIELALNAKAGKVYAIEKETEAADLIEINKKKFCTANVEVIRGPAPDAMIDLPTPTHAFIGGSAGNMKEILSLLLEKNPNIRVIINSVTLETISETMECIKALNLVEEETVCVNVSRSRKLGKYHLMTAQNPVYITVCQGSKE